METKLNEPEKKLKTKKGVFNINMVFSLFVSFAPEIIAIFLSILIVGVGAYFFYVVGRGEPRPGDLNCSSWSNAPADYQAKITQAANAAGIQPALLGAIYLAENGDSWGSKPVTSTDWPDGNGPFQIIDASGTWSEAWAAVIAAGKNNGLSISGAHAQKNVFYISALAAAFKIKMNFSHKDIKIPSNSSDEKAVLFTGLAYNAGISHGLEWARAGYDVSTPPSSLGKCWGNNVGSACTYAKRTWKNFQDLNVGCAVNSPDTGSSYIQECQGGGSTSPSNGNVIVLDPGHGTKNNDRSASGEEKVNLSIAKLIRPILQKKGYTVYLTHENINDQMPGATNEYTDNVARATFANSKKPALVLRIHGNTGAAEDFFMEYPQPNAPDSKGHVGPSADVASKSQDLTKKITTYLTSTAKIQTKSGAVTEGEGSSLQGGKGNLVMSTHSTVPLALIEMFGMESKNAKSTVYHQKIATALANAIISTVKINNGNTQTTIASPTTANCKIAGFALQTVKEVKDHECPDGRGCENKKEVYNKAKARNVKSELSTYAYHNGKPFPFDGAGFAECSGFVGYVIRNTVDPNFPVHLVREQWKYINKHRDKYDIQPYSSGRAKPGDIIFKGSCNTIINRVNKSLGIENSAEVDYECAKGSIRGSFSHVQIYIGKNSVSSNYIAEASLNTRGPMMNTRWSPMNIIARLIK